MKMRSPATSDMSHADIAALIDYSDMWEDPIHDVLHGYEDVPTHPEPVRLRLTKPEIAHRWHMIMCDRLNAANEGGDEVAIAKAMKAVEWTGAMSTFEAMKAALGDLQDGRCLTYVEQDLRHGIFRVVDSVGNVLANVCASDDAGAVERMLACYDHGVSCGRALAQAEMRSALGLQ